MGKPLSSILWRFALILGIFLVFSTIDLLLEEFFGENQNILISNRINRKIYERVTHTDYRYFDNTQFYDDYTWTLNNFYRQTFSAAQTIWRLLGALFTIGTIGALVISMDVVVLGAVVLIVVLQMLLTNAIQAQNYRKDRASLPFGRLLGYIQRGGSPSARDRLLATQFGARAVDLLAQDKSGVAVGIRGNDLIEVPFADVQKGDHASDRGLLELVDIMSVMTR